MAALNTDTGVLELPAQRMEAWAKDVMNGSSVATLSGQIPMIFGPGEAFVFDSGEAELVGESAQKSSNDVTPAKQTAEPHKFQKTIRMSNEVQWADEDDQLRIIDRILRGIQPALSRALDYGVFHGINPKTGAVAASITQKLSATTNSVEVAAQTPYALLDEAVALVLADGYIAPDAALDPALASLFVKQRTADGVKLYPGFVPSTEAQNLDGLRTSVSKTVGAAGVAAVDTDVKGFVGDFSAIQWGIQRQIGIELIEFGDPDGLGDLKRLNQVAFRAEVVYGWGIADLNAFAKIVDAV